MFDRLTDARRRWLEQRDHITALMIDLAAVPWDRGETPEYLAANRGVDTALRALPWYLRFARLYPADVEARALERTAGTLQDVRRHLFETLVDLDGYPGDGRYHLAETALWVAEGHPAWPASPEDAEAYDTWSEVLRESVEDVRQRRHDEMAAEQYGA